MKLHKKETWKNILSEYLENRERDCEECARENSAPKYRIQDLSPSFAALWESDKEGIRALATSFLDIVDSPHFNQEFPELFFERDKSWILPYSENLFDTSRRFFACEMGVRVSFLKYMANHFPGVFPS